MSTTHLIDLPGLKPSAPLDSNFTLRISSDQRQELERAAAELGVPPGKLVRAVLQQALAGAVETT